MRAPQPLEEKFRPPPPDIDDQVRRLLTRRRELNEHFKRSVFHLTPPEGTGGGGQQATDAAWAAAAIKEMGRVATYDPSYFPGELLGAENRLSKAARGGGVDGAALHSARLPTTVDDFALSSALARIGDLESAARQAGGGVTAPGAAGEEGEEDEEGAYADADNPDEDFENYEDDAYANYDDDDDGNYDDDYGGRDEGPIM